MSKFVAIAAAAVLCVAGQSHAAGLSNDTLAAMGLSGVTIVSDAEASEVRGMGYMGGGGGFALAAGGSIAYVGAPHAGAGSANVYAALGANGASGDNFSTATKTSKHVKIKKAGPLTIKHVKIKSLTVSAGGYSSAMSY